MAWPKGKPRKPMTAENNQNAPASFTETREFKEAVAQAAASMAQEIRKEILSQFGDAPISAKSEDRTFAEGLAMAIAQLGDQGTGRKRIAPEILKFRAEAMDRMRDLIVKAKKEGRVATYTLKGKVYLDEQIIEPKWIDSQHMTQDTEIDWPGVPNEMMVPKNATAKEIHAAFQDSIGSSETPVTDDDYWVTANGLVVRGAGPVSGHRQFQKVHGESSGEGVRIAHKAQMTRKQDIHVLGTLHPPAQQTV
jgi:hypothetical protein